MARTPAKKSQMLVTLENLKTTLEMLESNPDDHDLVPIARYWYTRTGAYIPTPGADNASIPSKSRQ